MSSQRFRLLLPTQILYVIVYLAASEVFKGEREKRHVSKHEKNVMYQSLWLSNICCSPEKMLPPKLPVPCDCQSVINKPVHPHCPTHSPTSPSPSLIQQPHHNVWSIQSIGHQPRRSFVVWQTAEQFHRHFISSDLAQCHTMLTFLMSHFTGRLA